MDYSYENIRQRLEDAHRADVITSLDDLNYNVKKINKKLGMLIAFGACVIYMKYGDDIKNKILKKGE